MHKKQSDVWVAVKSEAEWVRLESLVGGFHDGVIKEAQWSHGNYVNRSFEMVYAAKPRLWMLIQLQLPEIPTVEMRFLGVQECCILAMKELDATMTLESNAIVISLSSDGKSRIVAEECEYRLSGGGLLGAGPFSEVGP